MNQFLDIKTWDGVCDSYVAYPRASEKYPAVVMNMDAIGPRQVLYNMANRLASHGYYVLVPNLLYRGKKAPVVDLNLLGLPGGFQQAISQARVYMDAMTPDLFMRDAKCFLDFLEEQKNVLPGRVGLSGYCMGAGVSLRTAAQYPDRVAAVGSFHGAKLATDAPDSIHRVMPKITAEIYMAHADKDSFMPQEQIDLVDATLRNAGVKFHSEIYADAHHGYTMSDLPAYDFASAEKHWAKLLSLLNRNLK
jgi:carboxymethylenebutenolidase